MICDVCKKLPATVFLTQIIGGKMQKANLCEGCAEEKGTADPAVFAQAGCEVCKENPATVFLTQLVHRQAVPVNLCENCAAAAGISDDFLAGLEKL